MRPFAFATALLLAAGPLLAQRSQHEVAGHVRDSAGAPIVAARISLLESKRIVYSDSAGRFRLTAVPPGHHTVSVARLGYAPMARRVLVPTDAPLDLRLRATGLQMAAVQVTATPGATLAQESPQPIAVLEGAELRVSQGAAIGETLEQLPGVRSLSMTTGIGKPVIRGMTHYRVVTLDNGQRSETQAWGHDHSPNVETAAAERVEVIKGPASVLYGSDALGGVVNVIAPQVPDAIGQSPFARGRLATTYNHNTRGSDGTLALDAAAGRWGARGAVTVRGSRDMRTPDGRLENTTNAATATELAAGYRHHRASVQLRYAGREERIEIFDDPVQSPGYTGFQRIQTHRASSELTMPIGATRLLVNLGYENNLRREYPDAVSRIPDLGLYVANWTGFAHLEHGTGRAVTGTLGVSGMTSAFENRGSETLIPNSETGNVAVYLYEQADVGRWRFSGGARYDHRRLTTDGNRQIGVPAQTRTFGAVTGSAGALYRLTDDWALVGSMARGFRAPAAPDLFANGFHEGTRAFERGNPDLEVETSWNSELGVRVTRSTLTGELTGFVNRVSDYIYLRPFGSGSRAYDSLQVVQGDARLAGVEGRLAIRPVSMVTLQLSGDYVRGQNVTADVPLTFIPPLRAIVGVRVDAGGARGATPPPYLLLNVEANARQTRVDPRDVAPPGYTLTNIGGGFTRLVPRGALTVDLSVRNLFDTRYRSFMSRYKEFALGPGRSVVVRVNLPL